jgi:hydroxymethylglutaryl-CoA reductase (NADPH)
MNIRKYLTVNERRKALEKELNIDLKNIGSFTLDEATASTRNCENMIGVAQVPMGIAGPLKIKSNYELRITNYECYIPLATTEGALVASVNRGCKAITGSGGAIVDSNKVGATRGPVFRVENLEENRRLSDFLDNHFNELKIVAEKTSHHLTLITYSSAGVGKYRYVRFVFDTEDAMGLNMVTIATDAIALHIKEKTGISCLAISGNYCVDKKPSWQNIVNMRGISVWAEVTLTKRVLTEVLKTTAQKIYDVWLAKCMIGSAMSGSMAFNAQFANVVAAVFLATGQDVAHVVEGAMGITTATVTRDDLYMSIYLPDLMVGTVGGGTGLATQKEALSLLGVSGGNNGKNSQKFAEIIGATVLAGEISLLSSLEEGSLAKAHVRLGRGKKI